MSAETMRHCWEIMQCDEEEACPVRGNQNVRCWEWMQRHIQFQSQYGLCAECIVFLCQNENTVFAAGEIEQIMISRGLFQEDTLPCRRGRMP